MVFRVNQNMLNQNMMFNLQKSYEAMDKYQTQLASGKKITKPSDDPVVAVRAMDYQSSLNEIDQFKKNASDAQSWMQTTDDSLSEVTQVLQRVRELTVQGLNGSNDATSRDSIAQEINQLKEHLGEIANTDMGGKYIFAGTDTQTPPYRVNPATSQKEFMNTNQEKMEWQVGKGNTIPVNVSGTDVFNYNGGIMQVLGNIANDLESSNGIPSNNNYLSQLDDQMNNLLQVQGDLGARMDRVQLTSSRLDEMENSTTNLLSQDEDADIAQVITNLQSQENVHRAALSVGARIIQPSLVDFLR
jgi:flagellar hook-associated protein 3 FlgL